MFCLIARFLVMSHVLLVSDTDYTEPVYNELERLVQRGINLSLLSDGTFEPKRSIFHLHLASDLTKLKPAIDLVIQQGITFDAVVTKSAEWLTPLTALLSEHFKTRGPSPRSALLCRSKLDMREAFQRIGQPTPRFRRCQSFEEILSTVREFDRDCVAKPLASYSAYGAFLIRPQDQWEKSQQIYEKSLEYLKGNLSIRNHENEEREMLGDTRSLNFLTDYIVEEFITGPQISVDSLVRNGSVFPLGIAQQVRSVPPYFTQVEEYMPFSCSEDLLKQILHANEEAVKAVELRDAATHTEIILTEEGPRLLEIACRIGGDNIHDSVFQVSGYSLFTELILLLLGEERPLPYRTNGAVAMKYFLPAHAGVLTGINIPEDVMSDSSLTEIRIDFKVGQSIHVPPRSFDYLGYLQVRGDDSKAARATLDNLASRVSFTIDANPVNIEPSLLKS